MPASRLIRPVFVGVLVLAVAWMGWFVWSGGTTQDKETASGAGAPGGTLRATYQTEPTNFLRIVGVPTAPNHMISVLTQATLVRSNSAGELEPRLAATWTASPDGLTWTIDLRPGAKFSDGTPVTSADVVFSVRAALDDRLGSASAADLKVNGQPITVRALDAQRVVVTMPAPHGPGIAMLENLPVLPQHKLDAALNAGTLASAWATSVAPSEVVGAGPFVIKEYQPGQRILFGRNPHFFGRDESGTPLPYVDEIDMAIVPETNTELLRLQAGETDVVTNFVNADDLAVLRQSESEGRVQLTDAGPSIDVTTFWFNLRPGARSAVERPWLAAPEFRRAISHAVNRQAIVDSVYLGQAVPAYGPVTAGHGPWYVPDLPITEFDQSRARTLLTSIGLTDRDGDGVLEDSANQPVRFSVITRSGQPDREKTMAVVQEHLRQVGIAVDVIGLQQGEIVARYTAGDFDAIYFGGRSLSRDPNMSFWLSSGGFHYWNPGQTTPGTEWESRIDTLVKQQLTTVDSTERRRLFAEAQRILAEQLPALWFVAPRAIVPVSGRVRGATPSIFFPPVLWNAERLSLVDGGR
jgi:peptide/nickel transport system substrate-binding protein